MRRCVYDRHANEVCARQILMSSGIFDCINHGLEQFCINSVPENMSAPAVSYSSSHFVNRMHKLAPHKTASLIQQRAHDAHLFYVWYSDTEGLILS